MNFLARFHFPSVQDLLNDAARTFRRFPETLIIGIACAVCSIVLIAMNSGDEQIFRHLATLTLAIPLSYAIAIAADASPDRHKMIRLMGYAIGFLVLVLFDMSFIEKRTKLFWFRYWQLSAGFHLLAAFAPFIVRGATQGFWQYNRKLFQRFLLAILYSGTLHLGLSIALVAIDKLLGVRVDYKVYMYQWSIISFVLNTWVFLAGVPSQWEELDQDTTYPEGLRIFTSFILLPIVTLYLVILYIYIGKIIVTQTWPRGMIGWLVSGASILGIFSLMLVYPLRDKADNKWIPFYSRGFYIALYPLIVMLILALLKRTNEYGLTERRYFLFVIAGWLAVVATYFTFSRVKNIKIVPVTLCLLAFATAIGPWSAYAVSARWQTVRLTELLNSVNAFEDGKIKKPTSTVSPKTLKELSSIFSYFERMHGWKPLQHLFSDSIEKKTAVEVMKSLGLEFVSPWEVTEGTEESKNFYFNVRNQSYVEHISGYDWRLPVTLSSWNNESPKVLTFPVEAVENGADIMMGTDPSGAATTGQTPTKAVNPFELILSSETGSLTVRRGIDFAVGIPLMDTILRATAGGVHMINDPLVVSSPDGRAKVYLSSANGQRPTAHQPFRLTNIYGYVYLKDPKKYK